MVVVILEEENPWPGLSKESMQVVLKAMDKKGPRQKTSTQGQKDSAKETPPDEAEKTSPT